MFLSGMGGTGKSEVIKALVQFAKNISQLFYWNYDQDTIKITAMTGVAACQIPNGKTIHSQACLTNKRIGQANIDSWSSTKMLVIDEVSFLDEDSIKKLDKHLRILKQNDELYGGIHIIFVGDLFQLKPVQGKPLYKGNTIQFSAINKAVFLNISHRFDQDPSFGEIMRRLRVGKVTEEDIKIINFRYIENDDVTLPPFHKLRCACYMNTERNAYNNVIFMEHLKATHGQNNDLSIQCTAHTCIIKASIRHYDNEGKGKGKKIHRAMYNRLLDECGDADIINSRKAFVDIALKFFYNVPLMMNTNERIDELLANRTPCRGLHIKLKEGYNFVKEN